MTIEVNILKMQYLFFNNYFCQGLYFTNRIYMEFVNFVI